MPWHTFRRKVVPESTESTRDDRNSLSTARLVAGTAGKRDLFGWHFGESQMFSA